MRIREEISKLKILKQKKTFLLYEKEELYDQIDKKQEEIIQKVEDVLNDVLLQLYNCKRNF